MAADDRAVYIPGDPAVILVAAELPMGGKRAAISVLLAHHRLQGTITQARREGLAPLIPLDALVACAVGRITVEHLAGAYRVDPTAIYQRAASLLPDEGRLVQVDLTG